MTNRTIWTQEPTRYEVAVERGEDRYLVGYTARRSGRGLYAYLPGNEPLVMLVLDGLEDTPMKKRAKAIEFGTGWTVRFTGRTERTALTEGELPGLEA